MPGEENPLFRHSTTEEPVRRWDVHPSRERFIFAASQNLGQASLTLVQNFLEELQRLVPTD